MSTAKRMVRLQTGLQRLVSILGAENQALCRYWGARTGIRSAQIDELWEHSGDPWKGVRDLDNREGSVAVGRVSKIPEQDQFESFVARESVSFLASTAAANNLFFSSDFKPHDPFTPAARFANMFRAEDIQLPDTWGKVNLSTVPAAVRKTIERDAPTPELSDPNERASALLFISPTWPKWMIRQAWFFGPWRNLVSSRTPSSCTRRITVKCLGSTVFGTNFSFMRRPAVFPSCFACPGSRSRESAGCLSVKSGYCRRWLSFAMFPFHPRWTAMLRGATAHSRDGTEHACFR